MRSYPGSRGTLGCMDLRIDAVGAFWPYVLPSGWPEGWADGADLVVRRAGGGRGFAFGRERMTPSHAPSRWRRVHRAASWQETHYRPLQKLLEHIMLSFLASAASKHRRNGWAVPSRRKPKPTAGAQKSRQLGRGGVAFLGRTLIPARFYARRSVRPKGWRSVCASDDNILSSQFAGLADLKLSKVDRSCALLTPRWWGARG